MGKSMKRTGNLQLQKTAMACDLKGKEIILITAMENASNQKEI